MAFTFFFAEFARNPANGAAVETVKAFACASAPIGSYKFSRLFLFLVFFLIGSLRITFRGLLHRGATAEFFPKHSLGSLNLRDL